MLIRICTALVLALVFLSAVFFWPQVYFDLLLLAVTMQAFAEWARLHRFPLIEKRVFISVPLVIYLVSNYFPVVGMMALLTHATILLASLVWLVLIPLWLKYSVIIKHRALSALIGCVLLIATWGAMHTLHHISPWALLGVMLIVWLADSVAYFVGKYFGRHKLAPQISPNKTWEGVFGGIFAVIIYACVLFLNHQLAIWGIVLFMVLGLISIVGDLFESLLKRQAGFKDSGQLLPGHGGVLDRIDALMPVLPIATLCYWYFPNLFKLG